MAGVLETVREDDFVSYYIFPGGTEDIINANREINHILTNKLTFVSSVVEKYAFNYIWHKDNFNVSTRINALVSEREQPEEKGFIPHLYGITHYGDNIEDEWFIVYLLLQLTKEIDDIIVRVVDSDGEFLLIEAAEHLPSWANPDICKQRVYLFRGAVHLIPFTEGNESKKQITVRDALAQIRKDPELTLASDSIQNAIQSRIAGYPDKISEMLHRATAFVPVGVAALLRSKPNLVAPAVTAFCNRDPIDMKACRAMRYFPPENRVMTSVVFTKCLYAMITHQKFTPDRRTGWNMPPANSDEYKAHSIGMKLACGFEILVAQAKPSSGNTSSLPSDFTSDRSWIKYLNSLKRTGFFKDNLEGSNGYNDLMEKAQQYYLANRDEFHCESSVGQKVLSLLSSLEIDIEELKDAEKRLPPPDDENWLEINPKDLDSMLENRYGKRNFVTVNQNSDPSNIASKLTNFLEHVSDLDGAEFPDEDDLDSSSVPPVRPERGVKQNKGKKKVAFRTTVGNHSGNGAESPPSENKINFDPDAFSCALQNMLDFAIPDDTWDLESDDSMNSYEDEVDMDFNQSNSEKRDTSEFKQYMDQMDRELASSSIGQSFEKHSARRKKGREEDNFDDIENFQPVDIDMNALKNVLQSYQQEMGGAGPASTLLGPMGMRLESELESEDVPNE